MQHDPARTRNGVNFRMARLALLAALLPATSAFAQDSAPPPDCRPQGWPRLVTYKSAEDLGNGKLKFRLCDPEATSVEIVGNDLVVGGIDPKGTALERDATGLWSLELPKPVPSGRYSYNFRVNGQLVADPRADEWSPGWTGVQAVATVRGPEGDPQNWSATVPHGAVSEVSYWSQEFGLKRRALVYTPPGYMKGSDALPVLYLVHGAGGSPHSWVEGGNVATVMDNLIASGAVRPFLIVMPDGHVPIKPTDTVIDSTSFGRDLHDLLIPLVDRQFRTIPDADHRAMAGLSMGGYLTIYTGLPRSDLFHAVGIFSMGVGYTLGENGVAPSTKDTEDFAADYAAGLKTAAKDMDLVWVGMGKDDFLHFTVAPLLGVLDKYKIDYHYEESGGGHDWVNWRAYFLQFAPLLFRDKD